MLEHSAVDPLDGSKGRINSVYRAPENLYLTDLIKYAKLDSSQIKDIQSVAGKLIETIRSERMNSSGIDSFLTEYSLSSDEGVALMCLAEALLRVPDNLTIDSLIKDKLAEGNWKSHKGQSHSFFVNATTWALMLTGKVLTPEKSENTLARALMKLVNRSGEGVVRRAVEQAMRIMSRQFVMGRTISEAAKRAKKNEALGYSYSYDMLGEAALTESDAQRYMQSYIQAIEQIGALANKDRSLSQNPGISVKLSAIYPRYEESHRALVLEDMPPRLLTLAKLAKKHNIGLTVDAEESERLMLSLDIFELVYSDSALDGWHGFGLAVQSYQKRAFYVIDFIADLAKKHHRRIMVRLIKGAYWDTEIKHAQMDGFDSYPVFTRKVFTDVSFQACAKKLLTYTDVIYPQFATHNAYSVATILQMVGDYRDFEFQCLHGMGTELYEQIVPKDCLNIPCRIYAPVGSHEDLLPYLVRRLLENGANSSFVNRIVDEKAPVENLVQNPIELAEKIILKNNDYLPLPDSIFMPERKNSSGIDFTNRDVVSGMQKYYQQLTLCQWQAKPLIDGRVDGSVSHQVYAPFNKSLKIGSVIEASEGDVDKAISQAVQAFKTWSITSVHARAEILESIADKIEQKAADLMILNAHEAGKTWLDNNAEVREAVDFCRYYANQARGILSEPLILKGYTGERDELSLHPRGIFACISPWNFPLAIFTGQIVAALVTGNCVIAKPAEQTPMIAYEVVKIMYEAGVPKGVLQLLPGSGETIGSKIIQDTRIKGVVFTGSTQTAALINKSLASRSDEIVPLIAETGGQNAMIVDSSALLEQVTKDAIMSAFGSAGQRCSAMRVIYIQNEIYDKFMTMLTGAMALLNIGDPRFLDVDAGPVIDQEALQGLDDHIETMRKQGRVKYQTPLDPACQSGSFVAPTLIELDTITQLSKEHFGPILHIIRYKKADLDKVIDDINGTGYGLTLGIHTRINHLAEYIRNKAHVGNCYVNRNMVGAVVGLQPFGGEGKSGTGFKAGGPHYLYRFCHERTYTVDTTAAGGNASLMSLPEDY